jgi:predicted dinucleotide-binding enzyme
MKIGILGAGSVGGTLGKQWAARGHEVCFGARDPRGAKVRGLLGQAGPKAKAASVREAAAFGEVVVLAVPYDVLRTILAEAGDLGGKVVHDRRNRTTTRWRLSPF